MRSVLAGETPSRALWLSNETAPTPGEPLSSPTVDVNTGLPMTETLDMLRHLWFRGPDCIASAHFAVWRHPEAIAASVEHLQKHVRTAVASGRVRTSRGAVPSDRELLKLCHGNTGNTSIGGLSLAQFDALRAYRDGYIFIIIYMVANIRTTYDLKGQ